jgi:hypothetical protein
LAKDTSPQYPLFAAHCNLGGISLLTEKFLGVGVGVAAKLGAVLGSKEGSGTDEVTKGCGSSVLHPTNPDTANQMNSLSASLLINRIKCLSFLKFLFCG